MPITGRRYKTVNNLVRNTPNFGLPIVEGSFSVSINWQAHPTGSLTIVGIQEREINKYRAHFSKLGREFNAYGIALRIQNYAETSTVIEGSDIPYPITSYQLAIQLEGKHTKAAQCPILVRKGSSRSVNIAGSISLVSLARRGGIAYSGYNKQIEIPSTSGGDFTLTFGGELQSDLTLNQKMVDYSGEVIRTKNWKSGNVYNLTRTEVLGSVNSSINRPIFYKRTKLVGKDGILANSRTAVAKEKRKAIFNDDPLVLKPPVIRTTQQGDVAFYNIPNETNPGNKPVDVTALKGLDLNFDMSGPRKTLRTTTSVNGKVMREVVKTYGFAYLAREIENPLYETLDPPEDTPPLLVQNPESHWTQITEETTSYIYKKVKGEMELEATDPISKKKYRVKYLDESGDSVSTVFEKRYLTEVVTQGWRLGRFNTEQLEGVLDSRIIELELADDTLDELDRAYFNLLKESIEFQKFPFKSKQSYLLVDPQEYYDELEDIPFQTQKVKASDIGLTALQGREVLIATPDPTWVYPMMVIAETSQAHSFATMPNPDNVEIKDERRAVLENTSLTEAEKLAELKLLKLLPELTTGEDTFSTVRRVISPSKFTRKRILKDRDREEDIYTEYSYGASNQDQNFKNSLQNIKFSEIAGRPPTAESYPDVYVRRSELTNNNDKEIENTKTPVYYLNSNPLPVGCTTIPSIQVNTSILSKAIQTAKIELSLNNFLSTSEESVAIAYFYPSIRPGDYINSVDGFTRGKKRVKSVNFTIQYKGYVEGLGKVATCDGTQVTLGLFKDLTRDNAVTASREFENNSEGLKISVNLNIREDQLGEAPLLANMKSRRNR